MGRATRYFVRTEHGQKGPYTLRQMKASFDARALSPDTEYRASEEEEWRPIAHLKEKIARADEKKRAARIERAPDVDELLARSGQRPGTLKLRDALAIGLLVALGGAILWWTRFDRERAMGKPCHVPADCPSQATCLLLADPDRKIQPEGYCTFPCSDSTDCQKPMLCSDALEVPPQGATWDGMFKKGTRVCVKQ